MRVSGLRGGRREVMGVGGNPSRGRSPKQGGTPWRCCTATFHKPRAGLGTHGVDGWMPRGTHVVRLVGTNVAARPWPSVCVWRKGDAEFAANNAAAASAAPAMMVPVMGV